MKLIPFIIIGFQMIIWGTLLVILIFLVIRRLRIRDEEDFEKRDN